MHSHRILIVEDNPINQKVTGLMLKRLGYESEIADNGAIAIEMLKDERFELVLMDGQMPVMDGSVATRLIRETIPENRQPKIVVLSASMEQEANCFWDDLKLDGFITKPVHMGTLKSIIQKVLADPDPVSCDEA